MDSQLPKETCDEYCCLHGHSITPAGLLSIRQLQKKLLEAQQLCMRQANQIRRLLADEPAVSTDSHMSHEHE